MAVIEDFIDQSTGASVSVARAQAALLSGNYGGLTPIDADGAPVAADSALSPRLADTQAKLRAGQIPLVAQPPNYLMWAGIAFLVWYFVLRKK